MKLVENYFPINGLYSLFFRIEEDEYATSAVHGCGVGYILSNITWLLVELTSKKAALAIMDWHAVCPELYSWFNKVNGLETLE